MDEVTLPDCLKARSLETDALEVTRKRQAVGSYTVPERSLKETSTWWAPEGIFPGVKVIRSVLTSDKAVTSLPSMKILIVPTSTLATLKSDAAMTSS